MSQQNLTLAHLVGLTVERAGAHTFEDVWSDVKPYHADTCLCVVGGQGELNSL